jgi:phage terminase large subunit
MKLADLKASASQKPLQISYPEKAQFLFRPAPYKVMWGGRGSAKSWSFCRALLQLGATKQLFILCTREIQQSIDESVYKLLCDQVEAMGLSHFYTAWDGEIEGKNGTRFVFAGLKNQFRKIKSYEGVDICAVFEANNISDPAWEALEPTIRKDPPGGPFGEGSEIWVEFNPELATDATYKRFVLDPPEGAVVVAMNYWDNEWFPAILRRQMERMKEKDHDNYMTVWGGKPRKVLQGAVYAKEIQAALEDDPCRISPHVRWDPKKPVTLVADLGRADTCAWWAIQQFGMDHAVIDYYGNTGYDFTHYVEEWRERPHGSKQKYRIGKVILPHDAEHKVLSARFSITEQAKEEWGADRVPKVIPPVPSTIEINAVRSLFPRLFFNEKNTQEGMQCLQHYHYDVDERGQRKSEPKHDWASHAAKSLSHYALSLQADIYDRPQEELDDFGKTTNSTYEDQQTGWMR